MSEPNLNQIDFGEKPDYSELHDALRPMSQASREELARRITSELHTIPLATPVEMIELSFTIE